MLKIAPTDAAAPHASRFGSISWNERESRYSQAKPKLYGLFCALRTMRLYLIGISNLVIEVDASYIKGMLSNPNVQPNAAINCWIAAILLFDFKFKLAHVPADKHKGPDDLSRREPAPGEEEDDDPEDWVDNALSLSLWVVSWIDTFPTDAHYTDTPLTRTLTMTKTLFSTHALPAIAASPRNTALATLSRPTRRAPSATFDQPFLTPLAPSQPPLSHFPPLHLQRPLRERGHASDEKPSRTRR